MIVVKGLKKDYTDEGETTSALGGVTFTINKGDFVSIMGHRAQENRPCSRSSVSWTGPPAAVTHSSAKASMI